MGLSQGLRDPRRFKAINLSPVAVATQTLIPSMSEGLGSDGHKSVVLHRFL